ncbi:MAG: AMP nucleosidase [Nitratireductor sp.]
MQSVSISDLKIVSPQYPASQNFSNAKEAVQFLQEIYAISTSFLREGFQGLLNGEPANKRYRAYYPKITITTNSYAKVDSRLPYGHVAGPGTYNCTVTNPDLFARYLENQISLLISNHGVDVNISLSDQPIPLHFAFSEGEHVDGAINTILDRPLRDYFDAPDLSATDDKIANGNLEFKEGEAMPLAPFTAPRVDYSLQRLAHYTATSAKHFQSFVLFTNYQFYIDGFINYAKEQLADKDSGYVSLVEPGNYTTHNGSDVGEGQRPPRNPQMPAYHLKRADNTGITMVNIGVGPSNAKTMTDHIAVLRPNAWLMLGHCAGLRNTQSLGDYVLAHAYVREDNVLNDDLPTWIPIPALAEVQIALEQAVAEVTGLKGYELKSIMRTGTVATIDNRNWELRDQSGPVHRLSQSRAIGLDMESATIAANGYRFRVPYGTLLCVSDKPLHGELKLPGMATDFYNRQVGQHLFIGIKAMEKLRDMPNEKLHSRKLRAFDETAFQ